MNDREIDQAVLRYAYGRLIDTFSDKQVREEAAADLAGHLARLIPTLTLRGAAPDDPAMERFKAEGVHRFAPLLTRQQCIEVLRHLSPLPVFDNQSHHDSSGVPHSFETARNHFPVAAYRVGDILQTPHLLAAMLDPVVLDLAERHLGCLPTLYGANLYWSFPGHAPVEGVQYFHRDFDDLRFVTLFILITDVGDGGGAHDFILGTHRRDTNLSCFQAWRGKPPGSAADAGLRERFDDPRILFAMNPRIDPLLAQVFPGRLHRVAGPAGTSFAEDNFGFHRGVPPDRPRLLFWARYGYGPNAYTARVRHDRVPASRLAGALDDRPALRYLTRLLVDWAA